MNNSLNEFLTTVRRSRFEYGVNDCALVLATWWFANHGVDPAAHLRGTYGSYEGCRDLLISERGLLRLVWKLARSVGAKKTDNPKPGDFAVVRFQGTHFGAIKTNADRWAIKMSNGLTHTIDCRVIIAWSI